MKLSPSQKRAFEKLNQSDRWKSAYDLNESLTTLNSLVRLKLAKRKFMFGYLFFQERRYFTQRRNLNRREYNDFPIPYHPSTFQN